jgi:hypothetical protein
MPFFSLFNLFKSFSKANTFSKHCSYASYISISLRVSKSYYSDEKKLWHKMLILLAYLLQQEPLLGVTAVAIDIKASELTS